MNPGDLEPHLREAIAAVSPDLLPVGQDGKAGITKDNFEQIFFRLVLATDAPEATRLIRQLNAYLLALKAVHSDENPGLSVTRLKRPAARINLRVTQDLRTLLRLEAIFLKALTFRTKTREIGAGRLLFSAIRYGVLLREDRLSALCVAIGAPPRVVEEHVWFELTPEEGVPPAEPDKGSESDQPVIWSPDPLTLLLLYRWREEGAVDDWAEWVKNSKPDWFSLIKQFFATQGVKWGRDGLPKTRLLDAVAARWSLDIPAVLADCARGVHPTQTLHPQTYLRLITGKAPALRADIQQAAQPRPAMRRIHEAASGSQVGVRDSQVMREVGRHLRTGQKRGEIARKIRDLIEAESGNCSPLVVLLSRWVATRLTKANRWGNRFRAKSAYTRMRSIARRLQGWLGSDDPLQTGSVKLGEIYAEITDSVDSPGLRSSISKNLREFHEFLEDEYGMAPLGQDAPWTLTGKHQAQVDAKIVLPGEYGAAVAYYRAEIRYQHEKTGKVEQLDMHLAQARWLAMALGYRAGLRRREVIGLRLKDVAHQGRTEVLVRPHDGRKIKTHSGNRRSPVDVFFSAEELELLNTWLAMRVSTGATPDDYLFALPESGSPFIDESLIFDHIQWTLQTITGDASARFHHLRHSFGTWRLWRWMLPRYSLQTMPYKGMAIADGCRLHAERKRVLGLGTGEEPSEKVLYALALAIGHSGPSMTLMHYVHCDAWMLELETQHHTPQLDKTVLAEIGGVTGRQIESLADGAVYTAALLKPRVVRKLKKIADIPDIRGWVVPEEKRLGIYRQDAVRQRLFAMDVWEALQLHTYNNIPLEELTERYCVEKSVLQQAMERVTRIWLMKYEGAGHQSFRHRWPHWQDPELLPRVLPYPRQKRHLNLVRHVLERYEVLPESRRRLIRWAVAYFIGNGSTARARLRFDRKEDLKRFLRISNVLVLFLKSKAHPPQKLDRFNLTLHSPLPLGSPKRKEQWVRWGRGLNLKGYQCQDSVCATMRPGQNYVELRLLSLQAASNANNTRSSSRPTDWGFKLSLYVLAYAYG